MGKEVWISTAPAHASNLRPLKHSFSDNEDTLAMARDTRKRNDAGESLSAQNFPAEIFGAPHAKEKDYRLPNIFFAGSYWAVSQRAADVLRQFDLGGGGLYPVRVYKKDRKTLVDGEWLCINFGNVKHAFLPDESRNFWAGSAGKWVGRAAMTDYDTALSPIALTGPDIWIDPIVRDAIFFSDGLGRALKKAKADKGFFLNRCRVLGLG
ncbi:hypothetical protein [Sphingomonas sp. SRS2]|uniref:hypothetical protein n=1 Tax=Sphingomonas sp. SRS2 TaxID=133190 RepID=UPI000AA03C53|nr:hypothetical protein [Sphingomonas sp. SRS2]